MKKAACAVLILVMVLFLVNPSASEARGGSHHHWGWWAPFAIIGGAAVLAPYFDRYYAPYHPPYYYDPYYVVPPVVVQEQSPVSGQATAPASASAERTFIYPRQGQTEAQQANDRYECHRWSVGQTGFDPTQPSGSMSFAQLNQMRNDYHRALGACLDGRGYTMK